MIKWEYKVVAQGNARSSECQEIVCNSMGRDGWELVSSQATNCRSGYNLFFKRKGAKALRRK